HPVPLSTPVDDFPDICRLRLRARLRWRHRSRTATRRRSPGMTMSTEGSVLVDEHGRQRILHGINPVEKGARAASEPSAFRGRWTTSDIAQLQESGLDSVRLGVLWAAVEPAPGEYCEEHLRWLGAQLDQLHAAGLAVILDGHQDLFSQLFGDGAPAWATLT